MQNASTMAAKPVAFDRSRWLVPGLLFVPSGLAFASAAFSWVTLRPWGVASLTRLGTPRPVFSVDHRPLALAVGIVLLVLAIATIRTRVPVWAFVVGVVGSVTLAGFVIYDLMTGHHQTYDALVTYVAHQLGPADIGVPDRVAHQLLSSGDYRYSVAGGAYLAIAAAGLGLIACVLALFARAGGSASSNQRRIAVSTISVLVLVLLLMPACGSSRLTARIVLPTRSLVAGTTVQGKVIVTNETGKVVIVKTCGSPFHVALANNHYEPGIGWPLCLQDVSIPVGQSTWKVDVKTTNLSCLGGNQPGQKGMPKCLPNGNPPPLPVGTYRATLYQDPHFVSDPDPIEVQVTSS